MGLTYQSAEEIETLARAFNHKSLPQNEWTHQAHLTVAIWHLKTYDFYESLCRIRSGIISYNLSIGGINTGARGYHETLTVFWMKVIDLFIRQQEEKDLLATCNDFLSTIFSGKDMAFHFYTREILMAPNARAMYVLPDKMPVNEESFKRIQQQTMSID